MQNIIHVLCYLLCDILYYLYIYFVPSIICTSINIELVNIENIFRFPYFCIQFICEEDIAQKIFRIFSICSIDSFKYMYRYSVGNVQQIYIYTSSDNNVLNTVNIIENICKASFDNIRFVVEKVNDHAKLEEYFILYVLFSTLFVIISKYMFYSSNENSYLYTLTSMFMLLNSIIFYSNHVCFKYNLIFPNNIYRFMNNFIYLSIMLLIIYTIDTLFIWLNIKKNNLYEKN